MGGLKRWLLRELDGDLGPMLLCVRLVFLVQCVGMLRIALSGGSAITTTMFMDLGWHEPTSYALEISGAYVLVALACWTVLTGSRVGAAYGVVWFFGVAALTTFQGGSFMSDWTIPAHATRITVAAVLLVPGRHIERAMRIAIATTFATHGLEAIAHNPRFVDFLIRAGDVFAGVRVAERSTHSMLLVIGLVDLAAAGLLLTRARWRWLVAYMALWGVATALMRTINIGPTGLGQTLVRAANGGLPLALFVHWHFTRRDHVQDSRSSAELSPV